MTEAPVNIAPPQDEFAGLEDYWGTDENVTWYLPDGKQYFVLQPMNEGKKAKFQKLTSRAVTLKQGSGDAKLDIDPAQERWELIKASVVDWKLYKRGADGQWGPVLWNAGKNLEGWLQSANPKLVEKLEERIRLLNPWLQADMTVEQIDEELERLYELRKSVLEEQAGEDASANK